MNILMEEEPIEPHQFSFNVLTAFQQLSFFPIKSTSPISTIHLLGKIYLQRISRWIDVVWAVSLKKRKLLIELNINLHFCKFGLFLAQIFQARSQQVCDFIYIVNNLSLSQREGTFHLHQKTGNISLKIFIDFFTYSSTPLKKKTIIITHLRKIIATYVQNLERLIFYFKIPGFNLHQLQNMLQQQNSIPLKTITEKIQMLRHLYDKNKGTDKIDEQRNTRAIAHFLHGNKMVVEEGLDVTHNKLNRIDQEFKSEEKLLKRNLTQFQQFKSESILTAIDIKGKTHEHFIGKGGYGSITCAIYSYIPLMSIYDQNNAAKSIPEKQQQRIQQRNELKTGCSLVKKVCLDIEQADLSQKNECNFLTYMRGKVCPFFAKYFCNKSITPFSDGQIYIQYYPNSLEETQLTLENKLKVMQDVCMGILFLSSEQILHRDLKEVNIMVDRNKRGRIIDFGSVASFNSSQKFKPHDSKLRSTQDYYYSYRNLCINMPSVARRYTKDEYYADPKFDIFSFGKILFNQFSLSSITDEGQFLRHQLKYLSLRCMEIDPQLRWTIDQVIVFIRQLLIYNEAVRKFWKIGFDASNRVHQIGTAYPPKQFSNQQRMTELTTPHFKKQ